MKKIYHKIRGNRLVSLLIIMVLFVTISIPAFGLTQSTAKEEVVYVNLNYDGSVDKIYVVNSFELNEAGQIIDYGDYTSFREMTASDGIKMEKEKITIDAKAGKLYYEGTLNSKSIPWDFKIQYFIDKKEYLAESLVGKSGDLEIKMKVRSNVSGKNPFYDSLTLQASITLDTFICKNIKAEGATLANAGKNKLVSFMILPGKDSDLNITADVTDFVMEGISINAVPIEMSLDFQEDSMFGSKLSDLKKGVADSDDGAIKLMDASKKLAEGAGELKEGIGDLGVASAEVKDATSKFMNGTKDLRNATEKLNTGVGDLRKGTSKIQDGTGELVDGMNGLVEGTSKLSGGIVEVDNGLEQLVIGSKDLDAGIMVLMGGLEQLTNEGPSIKGGALQIFQSMTDTASMQLSVAGIEVNLTPNNYSGLLNHIIDDILAEINSNPSVVMIKNLKTELDANASSEDFDARINEANVQLIEAGIELSLTKENYAVVLDGFLLSITDDPRLSALIMVKMQLDGYKSFYDGLVDYTEGVSQASFGLARLHGGAGQLYLGLDRLRNEGVGELLTGMDELEKGTRRLRDGTIDLKEGVIELHDGVIELNDGTSKLVDGVIELEDGIIKLNDGMIEMSDGIIKLLDGAIELHDGTLKLHDGNVTFAEGTLEFRDKTATIGEDVKKIITDKIKEMMGGDFTPISFVSKKNTNVDSVQFAMKTPSIEYPEVDKKEEDEETNLNIFQKFLKLFGI